MSAAVDPVLARTRDEIAALDERLIATINDRIRKVAELRRYKAEQGLPFVDPEREQRLVEHLQRVNRGPLSDDGVRELLGTVLDLVKRELARG